MLVRIGLIMHLFCGWCVHCCLANMSCSTLVLISSTVPRFGSIEVYLWLVCVVVLGFLRGFICFFFSWSAAVFLFSCFCLQPNAIWKSMGIHLLSIFTRQVHLLSIRCLRQVILYHTICIQLSVFHYLSDGSKKKKEKENINLDLSCSASTFDECATF